MAYGLAPVIGAKVAHYFENQRSFMHVQRIICNSARHFDYLIVSHNLLIITPLMLARVGYFTHPQITKTLIHNDLDTTAL